MGERGPLPSPAPRRRNKQPESIGTAIVRRPTMPKGLRPPAASEWRRIVPELEEMGILARVDHMLILRYVNAVADWLDCTDKLTQTGLLVRGQKGNLVRNPLWMMRQDAERTATEHAKILGLAPTARLRARIKHVRPAPREAGEEPTSIIDMYKRKLGLTE